MGGEGREVLLSLRFVDQVARMTRHDEMVDGERFEMDAEDALETVDSLIGEARRIRRSTE